MIRGLEENEADFLFKTTRIFIAGMKGEMTEKGIFEYFSKFGRVASVLINTDIKTNRLRGFGYIQFSSNDSCLNVLQDQFHEIQGQKIETMFAVNRQN